MCEYVCVGAHVRALVGMGGVRGRKYAYLHVCTYIDNRYMYIRIRYTEMARRRVWTANVPSGVAFFPPCTYINIRIRIRVCRGGVKARKDGR